MVCAFPCLSAFVNASCAIRNRHFSRPGGNRRSPVTWTSIAWLCSRRRTSACFRSAVASPSALELGRPELEDRRPHLLARRPGERLDADELLLGADGIAVDQHRRGLGGQREAEDLLGDGVVQLGRQALALLDRAQLAAALVEPGVLDRDRGMGRQRLDQLQVLVAELAAPPALLLGQVEGADHRPVRDDRHAEERAHVRVLVGPPLEPRIGLDVLRAVRLRGLEHGAEEPVRPRQLAERVQLGLGHPGGDEALEAALAVGYSDRGVAGAGELAGALDDLLQDRLHGPLGRDREDGVADRAEGRARRPAGRAGAVLHAANDTPGPRGARFTTSPAGIVPGLADSPGDARTALRGRSVECP